MALFRFFQPTQPTARETGLGKAVVQAGTVTVFLEIQNTMDKTGTRKRKAYTAFTAEQRAAISKYVSKNGNARITLTKK